MTKKEKNKYSKNKLYENSIIHSLLVKRNLFLTYVIKCRDSINRDLNKIDHVSYKDKERELEIFLPKLRLYYNCEIRFYTASLKFNSLLLHIVNDKLKNVELFSKMTEVFDINTTSDFTEKWAEKNIYDNFSSQFNEIKNTTGLTQDDKSLLKNIDDVLTEIDNTCDGKLLNDKDYKDIKQLTTSYTKAIGSYVTYQGAFTPIEQIENSDKLQSYLKQIFINNGIESAIKIYTTNKYKAQIEAIKNMPIIK